MKRFLSMALALVALASCSKTDNVDNDGWNGELLITSGIETRASGTKWEEDDAIGVFMSETGSPAANVGLHNTKYTTSSTTTTAEFTVDSDSDFVDLYYPQSGNVDIVAHYPYGKDATVTTYPVSVADQTDLTVIDFMSAKKVDVEKSKDPLALTFYHMLSQLKVTLELADNSGLTAADLAEAIITVSGTQVAATATIGYDKTNVKPTATFSLSGNATDLSVKAASGVSTFIVVPQTKDVTFTITIDEVGEFYVTVTGAEFTSGDEHSYVISVSKTAVSIKGATITAWGTDDDMTLDANDLK